MSYQPPPPDAVAVELLPHTPPNANEVDFSLGSGTEVGRTVTVGASGGTSVSAVEGVAPIATVGGAGATTVRATTPDTRLDGSRVDVTAGIETTPETVSLSFRTRDADRWREFERAGDIDVLSGHAGQFRAVNRGGSDDGGRVRWRPREAFVPPLTPATLLVDELNVEQVSPAVDEIDLTLQRPTPRDETVIQSPALSTGDDWVLSLPTGADVSFDARDVGVVGQGSSPTGARVTLPLLCRPAQAEALVATASRPDAVVERGVPDGPDLVVDEAGSQTLSITTPADAPIPSGDWLVTDWSLTQHTPGDDPTWRVELFLADA